MDMLTNAARKVTHPCAPRSFSKGRAARLAFAAAVGAIATQLGCGGDGSTFPSDASYVAALAGTNEIPPRSGGSGTATFDMHGGVATYQVAVSNLSAPATLAHVLIGGRGVVGLVIARLPLTAPTGVIATGTIDLRGPITFNNTTISGDSLRTLFENGNAYVNVYTATYPSGEIRGQVGRVR
jgi:CHRD domain-containing protein